MSSPLHLINVEQKSTCIRSNNGKVYLIPIDKSLGFYTVTRKNFPICKCPNLHQILTDFSSFFHWHTLWTVSNNVINKYLTSHEQHCYTTMSCQKITKITVIRTSKIAF